MCLKIYLNSIIILVTFPLIAYSQSVSNDSNVGIDQNREINSTLVLDSMDPVEPMESWESVDKNLTIEKNYLNRRYDGFYKHAQDYKDYQVIRKQKVLQHKQKRQQAAEERLKAKTLYKIKKSQMKKTQIDFDALMLEIEKQRAERRKVKRDVFIRRKEIMNNLRRTTRKIPEEIDIGLKSLSQGAAK